MNQLPQVFQRFIYLIFIPLSGMSSEVCAGGGMRAQVQVVEAKYVELAGIKRNISPHRLRHFLLTWLKKQGIDDSFIQPYSGHSTRQSLEVYSKLSIEEAQEKYDQVINRFPV